MSIKIHANRVLGTIHVTQHFLGVFQGAYLACAITRITLMSAQAIFHSCRGFYTCMGVCTCDRACLKAWTANVCQCTCIQHEVQNISMGFNFGDGRVPNIFPLKFFPPKLLASKCFAIYLTV